VSRVRIFRRRWWATVDARRSNITILFANVRSALAVVTGQQVQKTIRKWPLWKQSCHVLHSTNQWFINPAEYFHHAAFHEEGMHAFEGEKTVIRA
jgi:hypothetical protein